MTYCTFILIVLSMMPCVSCRGDERIETELCRNFCLGNETCIKYETPVSECYNGQALVPDDPSWGLHDLRDDIFDNVTFTRKFYASKDGQCDDQTDQFDLPFDECVGPFGQPRPWGKFEIIRISNNFVPTPYNEGTSR